MLTPLALIYCIPRLSPNTNISAHRLIRRNMAMKTNQKLLLINKLIWRIIIFIFVLCNQTIKKLIKIKPDLYEEYMFNRFSCIYNRIFIEVVLFLPLSLQQVFLSMSFKSSSVLMSSCMENITRLMVTLVFSCSQKVLNSFQGWSDLFTVHSCCWCTTVTLNVFG